MAKIFITGIAGFLGSHLADKMLELGHEVVGCDNLIGGYLDNVPKEAKFIELDLHDLETTTKVMNGVDIVYHTACTAYEGLSVFSPSLITANTVQISGNAMTAAICSKVKRFVHCSSMARYGAQDTTPFVETMECKPQDPYGIAKYSTELLFKILQRCTVSNLLLPFPII